MESKLRYEGLVTRRASVESQPIMATSDSKLKARVTTTTTPHDDWKVQDEDALQTSISSGSSFEP